MQTNGTSKSRVKGSLRAIAGVMLALYVLLAAMAAVPALHDAFHDDSKAPGHHCAITLLTHGQIETPVAAVSSLQAQFFLELAFQQNASLISKPADLLPPGRAPPQFFVG